MLAEQFGGADRYKSGAQLLPASWLDDNLVINNQKLGKMIANVSFKFSPVKTEIVLSPNHCWTKLCYLLSSCSWETFFTPIFFFMLNGVRALHRQISSLRGCSLLLSPFDKDLVWSKSSCSTPMLISFSACHRQHRIKQWRPVSGKKILAVL